MEFNTKWNTDHLKLNLYEDEANAKGVVHVEIDLVDKKGTRVPDSDKELQFIVDGDATIIGLTNGNLKCLEPFTNKKSRETYRGRCLCIVRIGADVDKGINLRGSGEEIQAATIKIMK